MDQWGDKEGRETVVCTCEKKMAYEFSRGQNSWWEWRGELPRAVNYLFTSIRGGIRPAFLKRTSTEAVWDGNKSMKPAQTMSS